MKPAPTEAKSSKIDWDEFHARTEHPEDFVGYRVAADHQDAPWNLDKQITTIIRKVAR